MNEIIAQRMKKLRRERWNRRKKKIRPVTILIAIFLIGFGIRYIYKQTFIYLWNLKVFTLQKIVVFPERADGLVANVIELKPDKNLLFLNIREIHNRLCQTGNIEHCTVKKQLPSTLIIEIKPRKTWLIITNKLSSFAIDRNGIPIPLPANTEQYWKICGLKTGQSYMKENKQALIILEEIEKWYNEFGILPDFRIEELDIQNMNKIILNGNGKYVFIHQNQIKEQLEKLKLCLDKCNNMEWDWEYIDLRFKYPYVKKSGPKKKEESPLTVDSTKNE